MTETQTAPISEPGTFSSTVSDEPRPPQEILEDFVDGWIRTLDRDDKKALAIHLCSMLVKELSFTDTKAAELTAKIINKADRTIHQWHTDLVRNNGTFPESKQGRHQHTGVLWSSEELCRKAREYVRANCAVKGRPNMTTMEFCKWVNKTLLPNSTLEPGYPRKVSVGNGSKVAPHNGF